MRHTPLRRHAGASAGRRSERRLRRARSVAPAAVPQAHRSYQARRESTLRDHLLHDDVLQTVGRTPVVRLARLEPPHVEVYAKLEAFNPLGSVKDRMALGVIEDAERSGQLRPGQTVVEATSGNSGIGLAMVCARKGYPLVIVMAENFSVERRRLMRFLGAKVVLTPAALKGSGMLAKACELAAVHGWFWPRQFDNEANARVHEVGTAREILDAFADAPLTHWVSGSGTGGTLLGVARTLRRESPDTRIVVCEPDNSPVLAGGLEPADDHTADAGATSHPRARPHPVQGWSPDFVPGLVRRAFEEGLVDLVQPVSGDAALQTARELARREGILAGISGGATVAGALALAATLPAGSRVLAMVPDTGERYLSTPLFADIGEAMDEDEFAISRSTPLARFDAVPAAAIAPPAAAAPEPAASADALAFVDAAIREPAQPPLMFGLQWCEFSWTVRRFFEAIGVTMRSVDLDAPIFQAEEFGVRCRTVLAERTGSSTLPQVFVGGQWIGGCTETLQAWDDGRLQALLDAAGIAFDASARVDTRRLLPAWQQPR
jgi:cysteine synthase A